MYLQGVVTKISPDYDNLPWNGVLVEIVCNIVCDHKLSDERVIFSLTVPKDNDVKIGDLIQLDMNINGRKFSETSSSNS